jgi:uncharacterized protein (TIGR00369 family)
MTERPSPHPLTVRAHAHPDCVACSPDRAWGLKLAFKPEPGGGVCADFSCPSVHQGYPGTLHGGLSATLVDAAMTNCLFAQGQEAVTAELTVRYKAPVLLDRVARVVARVVERRHGIQFVEASIWQDNQLKVVAHGKFVPRPLKH